MPQLVAMPLCRRDVMPLPHSKRTLVCTGGLINRLALHGRRCGCGRFDWRRSRRDHRRRYAARLVLLLATPSTPLCALLTTPNRHRDWRANVRFWQLSGHRLVHRTCPLLGAKQT